jgi:hypothetical protein
LRQPWAYCAVRDGKTKIRAGIVRPSAAERRVLGLPKPNPPLERPFPPELIGYLIGGGEGNPEWSRRSTLGVKGARPRAGLLRRVPTVLKHLTENVTVCQGRGAGVFCAVVGMLFYGPVIAGLKRPA